MFWCLEEWQGRNKKKVERRIKKENRTGTCVEEKFSGKKKRKKKEEERNAVWRIKKEWKKKRKKRIMKYYHNFFTINFKGLVIIS